MNFFILVRCPRTQERVLTGFAERKFPEVEIFELQMRTEQKVFFHPVLFVSPLCACPMREIWLATR